MNHNHSKWELLANLWIHHRENAELKPLGEYLETGLALAYFSWSGFVSPTKTGTKLIDETFDAFVALCSEQQENSSFLNDMRLALVLTDQAKRSNALGEQP
ncbi:MAG TPA: hypothetical protein VIB80_02730 [Aquiluna sp.]